MMPSTPHEPITDPDGVRWNVGWFGIQLGGTCWMLTACVMYIRQAFWLGALFLAGFAATNALGFWLWSNRRRYRFFRSAQGMMLICGVSVLATLLALDFLAPANLKHDLFWQADRPGGVGASHSEFRSAYLMLGIMIPALLVQFEVLGRQARRKSGSGH